MCSKLNDTRIVVYRSLFLEFQFRLEYFQQFYKIIIGIWMVFIFFWILQGCDQLAIDSQSQFKYLFIWYLYIHLHMCSCCPLYLSKTANTFCMVYSQLAFRVSVYREMNLRIYAKQIEYNSGKCSHTNLCSNWWHTFIDNVQYIRDICVVSTDCHCIFEIKFFHLEKNNVIGNLSMLYVAQTIRNK